MIELDHVSKSFKLSRKQKREMGIEGKGRSLLAVSDVSFVCKPGRVFTLLGPNGAGKTTALRMIATMLKPTAGSIRVAGFDTVKEAQKVRGKIGFLTGATALYARLTPNEIIKYYADLHGMDSKNFERRKEELFDLMGIREFANRRIGKLSSGMKQKVSIVRTIIHDPEIVVFDEPTVGLDVITSRNIIRLIKDCRTQGKTVIFSTHIMGEVSLISDDLAVIHKGKLLFNDTFENFLSRIKAGRPAAAAGRTDDTLAGKSPDIRGFSPVSSIENEFIRLVEGE